MNDVHELVGITYKAGDDQELGFFFFWHVLTCSILIDTQTIKAVQHERLLNMQFCQGFLIACISYRNQISFVLMCGSKRQIVHEHEGNQMK
ncbi:CLUMA_CG005984, isoform A, partial [Clunio marinus]